jgi:arginine/lysine/ornithine decarboxylase
MRVYYYSRIDTVHNLSSNRLIQVMNETVRQTACCYRFQSLTTRIQYKTKLSRRINVKKLSRAFSHVNARSKTNVSETNSVS